MKCPKCGTEMAWRSHSRITNKILRKPYHFTRWQKCYGCGYIQHYEKFKVKHYNKTEQHNGRGFWPGILQLLRQ